MWCRRIIQKRLGASTKTIIPSACQYQSPRWLDRTCSRNRSQIGHAIPAKFAAVADRDCVATAILKTIYRLTCLEERPSRVLYQVKSLKRFAKNSEKARLTMRRSPK